MSQPYIGEIRMFAGTFAPAGWAICDGSLLNIADYDTLFNLIGTTYGGDGSTTFALPDLRGRIPVHQGQGPGLSRSYAIGEIGGGETVTLTSQQIPVHNHSLLGQAAPGTMASPEKLYPAASALRQYETATPGSAMAANAISSTGNSQPHDNMMPYLAVNFIISLFGVFPQA